MYVMRLDRNILSPLLPYLDAKDINGLRWTGEKLLVKHTDGKKGQIEDPNITNEVIEEIIGKICEQAGRTLGQELPLVQIDAEMDEQLLHIVITHPVASISGNFSSLIRKLR